MVLFLSFQDINVFFQGITHLLKTARCSVESGEDHKNTCCSLNKRVSDDTRY